MQEDGSVKLIDFGAAATLAAQAEGLERTVVINEAYAAPDQYDPDGPQGPWTDVYNLCATLYAVLTGEPPWKPAAAGRRAAARSDRQGGAPAPLAAARPAAGAAAFAPQAHPEHGRVPLPAFHLPLPEEVIRRRRAARAGRDPLRRGGRAADAAGASIFGPASRWGTVCGTPRGRRAGVTGLRGRAGGGSGAANPAGPARDPRGRGRV